MAANVFEVYSFAVGNNPRKLLSNGIEILLQDNVFFFTKFNWMLILFTGGLLQQAMFVGVRGSVVWTDQHQINQVRVEKETAPGPCSMFYVRQIKRVHLVNHPSGSRWKTNEEPN